MENQSISPKILFIADKWCAGDLNFGPSEWETNLWKSLKSTGLANVELFHFDNYYLQFKKLGDKALINKIGKFHPDMICLIIYKMPGSDFNVPRWETLSKIKNFFKIPVLAIWGDPVIPEQIKISQALLPYTTINGVTESSAAVKRLNNPEKYIYVWVPKDPEFFNDPKKQRDIDISYLGSSKNDRLLYINYLIESNVSIFHGGGEREKRFSTQEYANILQRSKMTLSFSRSNYSHVINARPFEAMNCGAMVLEEENFETPKLFIPFVDYVPYTNKKDLLEKIRYYLDHNEEREIIAENGYKKVSNLYTAKRFWQLVIERALKTSSRNLNNLLFLKLSNLSHLSQWTRFKLKFLDVLCSNRLGFKVYKIIMKASKTEYWKSLLFMLLNLTKVFLKKFIP